MMNNSQLIASNIAGFNAVQEHSTGHSFTYTDDPQPYLTFQARGWIRDVRTLSLLNIKRYALYLYTNGNDALTIRASVCLGL